MAQGETPDIDDTDAIAADVDSLCDNLGGWVRARVRERDKPLAVAMALMKMAAEVIRHDDDSDNYEDDVAAVARAAGRAVARLHNEGGCVH
jgi:hypothetical protein